MKKCIDDNYYFNRNGKPDTFLKDIIGCGVKNSYFHIKKFPLSNKEVSKLYTNDLTFNLETINDNIVNISINTGISPDYYFNIKENNYLKSGNQKIIESIKSNVKNGPFIEINTLMRKIPFYKTYGDELKTKVIKSRNVDGKFQKWHDGHYFLILDYCDKYFYIVEDYENLINGNYEKYSNDVYKIPQTYFKNAFNYYAHIVRREISESKLKDINKNFINSIESSISNYFDKNEVYDGEVKKIKGQNAYFKLINEIKLGRIRLDTDIYVHDVVTDEVINFSNIFRKIDRVFQFVIGRKKILERVLLDSCPKSTLLKILQINITKTKNVQNIIRKNYLKKNYILCKDVGIMFEDLLFHEDSLFYNLEKDINILKE